MKTVRRLVTAVAAATAMAFGATSAVAAPHGAKIFVIGGKPSDPFWSKVKHGADEAGLVVKAQGGSVVWLGPQNYDNLGPDAAKLIRIALSQHPGAIAAPDWVPQAEDSAFKAVVAAHVPLIVYNAGGWKKAEELGAMNYIGSENYLAGIAGGKYFGKRGVEDVLCINTLPGGAFSESRCKGVADGIAKEGGKSTELPLPSSSFGNPTAVAQAIKAELLKHRAVDGVITISAGDADSAATAISQADDTRKVKLGSFDFDMPALERMKAGTQMFAIDQQPYMQGFLAVSLLNAYVKYGLKVPTRPILTGPAIVDKSNVNAALAGVKAGVR